MSKGTACMWMRGGTSKGGYFLAEDLPKDLQERDRFLLAMMGSPDPRQIDGMGGADPLTSKVAVISPSGDESADVDYLFLQVSVDEGVVTDAQNCGNILTGVGPFAIERGLVKATDNETEVRVRMVNTGQFATITVQTPAGKVIYDGNTQIAGVPGHAAAIAIEFSDIAGSLCGALLPTGNVMDRVDGLDVTLIDNGMPTIVVKASDVGIAGTESREELEANGSLRQRLEQLRLAAGPLMNLGDVKEKTVPKITMVSAPQKGGTISTRTFIPHRCHASIGVLGAVSVATACFMEGTPAYELAERSVGEKVLARIEHPLGENQILLEIDPSGTSGTVEKASVIRTARKLFDGKVFG
ncbi:4-oxalomesaconate tautomerase [hydrothermal vent metagenome]|uniref:4-oxalomesaconate tautomerase n=1 Tax=hydrothermal vent metagenome TaxID=652676 RepID=A0A3B0SN98_9ZZZZ